MNTPRRTRARAPSSKGMEKVLAVVADFASTTADGKLNVMGVFQEINPPELPFVLPQFFLVLSFASPRDDAGLTLDVRINLVNSSHEKMLTIGGESSVPQPRGNEELLYTNQIAGLAGLTFFQPGKHEFQVTVNGQQKATIPLSVNPPLEQDHAE